MQLRIRLMHHGLGLFEACLQFEYLALDMLALSVHQLVSLLDQLVSLLDKLAALVDKLASLVSQPVSLFDALIALLCELQLLGHRLQPVDQLAPPLCGKPQRLLRTLHPRVDMRKIQGQPCFVAIRKDIDRQAVIGIECRVERALRRTGRLLRNDRVVGTHATEDVQQVNLRFRIVQYLGPEDARP